MLFCCLVRCKYSVHKLFVLQNRNNLLSGLKVRFKLQPEAFNLSFAPHEILYLFEFLLELLNPVLALMSNGSLPAVDRPRGAVIFDV